MIMEILITINHEHHDYQDYTYAYICIHMHIYACIDAQNHSDNNYSNNNSSDNSDNCSIDNTKYSGIFNNIPIWVIILRDVHVLSAPILFPQQRKLTGSSAQNSSAATKFRRTFRRFRRRSGRLWCRARSRSTGFRRRFQRPEALVQSQVRFNRVPEKIPEKVRRRFGRLCSVQSQVKFNRVPEKVPEQVPGGFGAEPGQVQQSSGEGSGDGLGGFGAKPGQVQQGSEEVSGEGSGRLWCRVRSGS